MPSNYTVRFLEKCIMILPSFTHIKEFEGAVLFIHYEQTLYLIIAESKCVKT